MGATPFFRGLLVFTVFVFDVVVSVEGDVVDVGASVCAVAGAVVFVSGDEPVVFEVAQGSLHGACAGFAFGHEPVDAWPCAVVLVRVVAQDQQEEFGGAVADLDSFRPPV
jgi:hypothetical protein